MMQSHKFAVGQKVAFRPDHSQLANRGEVFVIMRQLPEAAGLLQYQIKSELDGHARVARRKPDQRLVRVSPTAPVLRSVHGNKTSEAPGKCSARLSSSEMRRDGPKDRRRRSTLTLRM
jgi:hypothetical protein